MPDWSPHHDARHRDGFWKGFEEKEGNDLLDSESERARVFDFRTKLHEVNRAISREEIVNAPAVQLVVDRGLSQMSDHWVLCFHSRLTVRQAFLKEWVDRSPASWFDHLKFAQLDWLKRKPESHWRLFVCLFCDLVLRWKCAKWKTTTHRIEVDEVLSGLVIPEGQTETCLMVYEAGKIVPRKAPTMAELGESHRRTDGKV